VNLVLFETTEIGPPLSTKDPRATHILTVLRQREGDSFDVGLINGPRGKACLTTITPANLILQFSWGDPPPPLPPLFLLIGLPRPQTARKILQEATTLGVSAIHFVKAERAERSYARSTLWSSGEWRRHLYAGASQAFCTRLPDVSYDLELNVAIARTPSNATRLALDNYESPTHLAAAIKPGATPNISPSTTQPVVLAIGSERGWTSRERDLLRAENFTLAHLGPRVLRTETACVAAIAIVKSGLGWF
jgi:RsmE family RNA methyltransferase